MNAKGVAREGGGTSGRSPPDAARGCETEPRGRPNTRAYRRERSI